MLAFNETQWALLIAMVGFYLVLCTRTAWAMRRSGRSFFLWLAITIFTTSIPATMVMFHDRRRGYCPADLEDEEEDEPAPQPSPDGHGDEMVTCPKCGRTMRRSQLRRLSGKPKCPHCGSKFDKARPPQTRQTRQTR